MEKEKENLSFSNKKIIQKIKKPGSCSPLSLCPEKDQDNYRKKTQPNQPSNNDNHNININNNEECSEKSQKQESIWDKFFNTRILKNKKNTLNAQKVNYQQRYKDEKKLNQKLNRLIQSTDQTIKSKNQTIQSKNQTIRSMNQTIKLKDQMINSLKFSQELKQKQKQIYELKFKINSLSTELKRLQEKIMINDKVLQEKQAKILSIQQIVKKKQKELTQKAIKYDHIIKTLQNVNQIKNHTLKQLQEADQKLKQKTQIYQEKLKKIQQNLQERENQIIELSKKLNKEAREQETQVEFLLQLPYAFEKSGKMFSLEHLLKHATQISFQKHSVINLRLLYKYTTDRAVLFSKLTSDKKNLLVIAKTVEGQVVGGFTSYGFEQNSKFDNNGYGFLFSVDKMRKLNYFDLKSPQKLPSQNLKDQIRFGYRELIIKNGNYLYTDFGTPKHQSRGHYANPNKVKRNQFIISQKQQFQAVQLQDYEIYQLVFENQIILDGKEHQKMIENIKNLQSQLRELKQKSEKNEQALKEKNDQLMDIISLQKEKQKLVCEELQQKYQLLAEQCKRKEILIEQQQKEHDLKVQQKNSQIQELKRNPKQKVQVIKSKLTHVLSQLKRFD